MPMPAIGGLVDGVRVVAYDPLNISGNGEMTMLSCQGLLTVFCAALLFTILRSPPVAAAADKDAEKEAGKVAGILIDKKDNSLTVKADGEDDPVKYLVGKDSDRKLMEA